MQDDVKERASCGMRYFLTCMESGACLINEGNKLLGKSTTFSGKGRHGSSWGVENVALEMEYFREHEAAHGNRRVIVVVLFFG